MADYSWFNKRYLRSIDQLRPWNGNPRLDPEVQHSNLRDYVEDIILEDGDKKSFMDLIRSIATNGLSRQTLLLYGRMRIIIVSMWRRVIVV